MVIRLLSQEADIVYILAGVQRDAAVNSTNGVLSAAELRVRLERLCDRPLSYSEVQGRCKHLADHGLVVARPGPHNSKLLCLSEGCLKVLGDLSELAVV